MTDVNVHPDPAVAAALTRFKAAPINRFRQLGVAASRQFADLRIPGPPVARVEDRDIAGGDGQPLSIRIYRPEADNRTLMIWLHGGGWALGSLESHDSLCRSICRKADASVIAVNYRLAPEHPFPAGLEDTFATYHWAREHARELGCDPETIVLAGDSAGGNLAAATCLLARSREVAQPALQVLAYPACDHRSDRPSWLASADAPFLDAADARWFAELYGAGDLDDPLAWPSQITNAAGLAPALLITAECDLLRDGAMAYAERLRDSQVGVEVFPGTHLYHSFLTLTPTARMAQAALAQIADRIDHIDPGRA
jgi:acetyl esterase